MQKRAVLCWPQWPSAHGICVISTWPLTYFLRAPSVMCGMAILLASNGLLASDWLTLKICVRENFSEGFSHIAIHILIAKFGNIILVQVGFSGNV